MNRLVLGAIAIGFAPIFVKLVRLGPTPIGFYRCAWGALFLFLYSIVVARSESRKAFGGWTGNLLLPIAAAGLVFSLDLYVWHRSVIDAGAGIATILGNTQVFYVALAALLIFRDRLGSRFFFAAAMALLGVVLLVQPQASIVIGPNYWLGIVFGCSTGVIYASYILLLRKINQNTVGVPAHEALALISAITAVTLFLVSLDEGTLRLPLAMEWLWLILLAGCVQVLGWLMISTALPKLPVSRAGLVLVIQPLVATILGVILFRERFSPIQILGAGITIAAIYLGGRKELESKLVS